MNFDLSQEPLFPWVGTQKLPVLIYGMGDGAEKVLKKCREYGIVPSEIFASDGFVRGQRFAGYQVKSYSAICRQYEQAVVLVAFGSSDPAVIHQVEALEKQFTVRVPDLALFGEDREILSYGDQLWAGLALYEPEARLTYLNLINYKISGRLDFLRAATSSKAAAYSLLQLGNNEVYVDGGAYDGDTIREFLQVPKDQSQWAPWDNLRLTEQRDPLKSGLQPSQAYKKIIALEPDPRNFRKLRHFAETSGLPNLELIQQALGQCNGLLSFDDKAGRSSFLSPVGRKKVQVSKLDDLVKEPVTLLKLDVEGAEREALLGSSRILQQDKPRLILSAYHRSGDLLELPRLIKEINPSYRLSLRHHPYIPAWDTNIYAW